VRRRPASRRSCCLISSGKRLASTSKRSCTAVATLFTFCPPGPDARTNDSLSSLSSIHMPSATRIIAWRSVAEVIELQRHSQLLLAQHGDNLLQVVALFAGDAHFLSLNGRLYLHLLVFDQLDDLARQLIVYALPQGDSLPRFLTCLLDLAQLHAAYVHPAPGQLAVENVQHLLELELRLAHQRHDILFLLELGLDALEVEAIGHLPLGLIDRVGDLMHIQLR